jgi:hypothetical protein
MLLLDKSASIFEISLYATVMLFVSKVVDYFMHKQAVNSYQHQNIQTS